MARPIWTGTISFGLLHVPIRLYTGERSVDLHFRMLDSRDKKPIRYERVNTETGREVAWKDVVKAFEYKKGSYTVIDSDAIKKAAPEATQTIDLETFVEREAIDPRYFDKPYLLTPDRKADKPYVLLRETLKKTGRVGIAKVVIRTRQHLAMLMPHDDALVLMLMRFPQELVDPGDYRIPSGKLSDFKLTRKEIDMAAQLIDSMSSAWQPDEFHDDFRERLRKLVEKRVKDEGEAEPEDIEEEAPPSGNDEDFMALLRDSLKSKNRGKPAGRSSRGNTRRRSTRKKAASKKSSKSARSKSA